MLVRSQHPPTFTGHATARTPATAWSNHRCLASTASGGMHPTPHPSIRTTGRGPSESQPDGTPGCVRLLLLVPPFLSVVAGYPALPAAIHSLSRFPQGPLPLALAGAGLILAHLAIPGYYVLVVSGVPQLRMARALSAISLMLGIGAAVLSLPAFLVLAYPLTVLPLSSIYCCILLLRELHKGLSQETQPGSSETIRKRKAGR